MSAHTKIAATPRKPRRVPPARRGAPTLDDFEHDALSPEEYARYRGIGRGQAYERCNRYRSWADGLPNVTYGLPIPPRKEAHRMIVCHRFGGEFVDGRLRGGRLLIPKQTIRDADCLVVAS